MKIILSTFFTLSILIALNGQIYVNDDAIGLNDGTSWANAYVDLQDAINFAQEGSELWVAQGIYIPKLTNVPEDSNYFRIATTIKLYGGFSGDENELSERDWEENESILSGDILQDDIESDLFTNKTDNIMHVVATDAEDILIDGFTIQGGKTRLDFNTNADDFHQFRGGGIFCAFNTLFRNCIIKDNLANQGGGIFNRDGNIVVENCSFENNYATSWGGAATFGNGLGSIKNSSFINNTSEGSYGGSIFIYQNGTTTYDTSYYIFENCEFSSNQGRWGGAISFQNLSSIGSYIIKGCSFINNKTILNGEGGAIRVYNASGNSGKSVHLNIHETSFKENKAEYYGGALYVLNHGDSIVLNLKDSQFDLNQAEVLGGALTISNQSGSGETVYYQISNCSFLENSSQGRGGAIWNGFGNNYIGPIGSIKNCVFENNFAAGSGGAIYSVYDKFEISDCSFIGNSTIGDFELTKGGGAIGLAGNSYGRINNTIFENNFSGTEGSAIMFNFHDVDIRLENVLFNSNEGLSTLYAGGPLTIVNNTFVNNDVALKVNENVSIELQNSIFSNEENLSELNLGMVSSKGGNFSSDDSFEEFFFEEGVFPDHNAKDPELNSTFAPLEGSPVIDAGNPEGITGLIDLGGNDRNQGGKIDAGAFESSFTSGFLSTIAISEKLKVFPNPVQNKLNINLDLLKDKEIQSVAIYKSTGHFVERNASSQSSSYNALSYSVEHYNPGDYFVLIKTSKSYYWTRFVKI